MQYFGYDLIPALVKQSNTVVRLPGGFHLKVQGIGVSGASALDCDLSTNGAGGLDTGAMVAHKLYFVYAVYSSSTSSLVSSLAVPSVGPTGFTVYQLVGAFYSNKDSQIGCFVPIVGAPESDWLTWVPTGTWTSNVTYTGKWRRLGSDIYLKMNAGCTGAPNSTGLTFDILSGYTIDIAELLKTGFRSGSYQGKCVCYNNEGAAFLGTLDYASSTTLRVSAFYDSGIYEEATSVNQATPFTFGSSDGVVGEATIPIVGWSNIQLKDL